MCVKCERDASRCENREWTNVSYRLVRSFGSAAKYGPLSYGLRYVCVCVLPFPTISAYCRDIAAKGVGETAKCSFSGATKLEKFLPPARIETVMIWEGGLGYDSEMKTRAPHGSSGRQRTCRTSSFTRYNISRGGTIEQTNFERAAPDIHREYYYRELYISHLRRSSRRQIIQQTVPYKREENLYILHQFYLHYPPPPFFSRFSRWFRARVNVVLSCININIV